MKKNILHLIILLSFCTNYLIGQTAKIGNEESVDFKVAKSNYLQPKTNPPNGDRYVVYQKEFASENAFYIKLHFKNFNLAPGDYLEIKGENTPSIIYEDKGKVIDRYMNRISEFWSKVIFNDKITIKLYSTNNVGDEYGFEIDKVAYGLPEKEIMNRTNVGRQKGELGNTRHDDIIPSIECYKGTEMYEKAKAVCLLIIGGTKSATGWLLGNEGHILTTDYRGIYNQEDANNTDYVFDYQDESGCEDITQYESEEKKGFKDVVASSATFIKKDIRLGYTLVKLPVNPTDRYGYLSLSTKVPSLEDRVYIPQCRGSKIKELFPNFYVNCIGEDCGDTGVLGSLRQKISYDVPNRDIDSYLILKGAGAPVIDYETNLVVALNNASTSPIGSSGRCDGLIRHIGDDMPENGVNNPDIIASFPYHDSFEGKTKWKQVSEDDGDWIMSWFPASYGIKESGPAQAAEGNYYMYLDASNDDFLFTIGTNARAILESPYIDLSKLPSAYLTFSDHMYGRDMGRLKLEISIDKGENWNVLWATGGNRGNQWHKEAINLKNYLGELIQLRFVGDTGSGELSNMAIDDFSIVESYCSTTVNSFPYREGFEHGIGAWKQLQKDDTDWVRNSQATPSYGTGPDGSIEGNYYLYVEASDILFSSTANESLKANLESPCFDFSGLSSPYITFYNHMYGTNVGTLKLKVSVDGIDWDDLWETSGNKGNEWNFISVNLSAYEGQTNVRFRFEVATGDNWSSDIAIDNISVLSETDISISSCSTPLNFNDYEINSFSVQDISGDYFIENNGSSLILVNNTWKYIPLDYTVTSNTILEFDFYSSEEGEVHAIGFEDDNILTSSRYFKLFGTQDLGITNYSNYVSGIKTYRIPIGNSYTGTMDKLVFINDDDVRGGNVSVFSNVKVYERGCDNRNVSNKNEIPNTIDILGLEEEIENFLQIIPNPVTKGTPIKIVGDKAFLRASYMVFNEVGQLLQKGKLNESNSIDTSNLTVGMYVFRIISLQGTTINKKIIIK